VEVGELGVADDPLWFDEEAHPAARSIRDNAPMSCRPRTAFTSPIPVDLDIA